MPAVGRIHLVNPVATAAAAAGRVNHFFHIGRYVYFALKTLILIAFLSINTQKLLTYLAHVYLTDLFERRPWMMAKYRSYDSACLLVCVRCSSTYYHQDRSIYGYSIYGWRSNSFTS